MEHGSRETFSSAHCCETGSPHSLHKVWEYWALANANISRRKMVMRMFFILRKSIKGFAYERRKILNLLSMNNNRKVIGMGQTQQITGQNALDRIKDGKTVTLETNPQKTKTGYHIMRATVAKNNETGNLDATIQFVRKNGQIESVKDCYAKIEKYNNKDVISIYKTSGTGDLRLGRYDPSTKDFMATFAEITPVATQGTGKPTMPEPEKETAKPPLGSEQKPAQKPDTENEKTALKNKIIETTKKIGGSIASEYRDLRRKESMEGGFTDKEQRRRLSELWGLLNNDFSLSDVGKNYVKDQLKTDYEMLAALEKQSAQITETTARPAPAPVVKKEYAIERREYGDMIGIKITGSGAEIIMENALKGRDIEEAKAAALKQMQKDSDLTIHRGLPTGFDLATVDMKNYEIILDPNLKYVEIMPKPPPKA